MNYADFLRTNLPNDYKTRGIDYKKLSSMLKKKEFNELYRYEFIKKFEEEYSKFIDIYDQNFHRCYFTYLKYLTPDAEEELLYGAVELFENVNNLVKYVTLNITGLKKLAKKHDFIASAKIYYIFKKKFRQDVGKITNFQCSVHNLIKEIKNQDSLDDFENKHIKRKFILTKNNRDLSKFYSAFEDKDLENLKSFGVTEIFLDNDNFDLYTSTLYTSLKSEIIKMSWLTNDPLSYIIVKKKSINLEKNEENDIQFKLHRKNLLDFLGCKDVWSEIRELNQDSEYVRGCYYEIRSDLKNKSLKIKSKVTYTNNILKRNDEKCEVSLKHDLAFYNISNNIIESEGEIYLNIPYGILSIKYKEENEVTNEIFQKIKESNIEEYEFLTLFGFSLSLIYKDIKQIPKWIHLLSINILKDSLCENANKEEIFEIYNNSREISHINDESVLNYYKTAEERIILINTNKFLNWLCFAVLLGGVGSLSISLDPTFLLGGTFLVLLSLLCCVYSLYLYFKKKYYF